MPKPQTNKIITVIVILVVLGGGYFFFFKSSPTPTASLVSTTESNKFVGQDILDLVNTLKTVSIDPAIFSGPLFQHLHDFTVAPEVQSQGRTNPFAPIGSENGVQILSTTTSSVVKLKK